MTRKSSTHDLRVRLIASRKGRKSLFGWSSATMSRYMEELCDALARVLDRCAQLDRRRLAGYAANIDFWVSEIQHRLLLVDGCVNRRHRMLAGTDKVYADDINRTPAEHADTVERLVTPNVVDTSTDWIALERDTAELRKKILGSAKGFVMKCLAEDLIDQDKLFQIEDRLHVNLRVRKPREAK